MLARSIRASTAGEEGPLAVRDLVFKYVERAEMRKELLGGPTGHRVKLTNYEINAIKELRCLHNVVLAALDVDLQYVDRANVLNDRIERHRIGHECLCARLISHE